MFKITHYSNSFISLKGESSLLVCDPWVGKTTDNGWYSYPIISAKDIDKDIFNADYIYISHIHCDHIDIKTLKKFKNKNFKFIIKKFKSNNHLKKRLQKYFKNEIIELTEFKKTRINKDFSLAIIPQFISNNENLNNNISYEIDTSLVVQFNKSKKIFYNNVDLPNNLSVMKKINDFVKMEFKKKINIFCCGIGAASEFPQCFLNIDRKKEQKRITDLCIKKVKGFLQIIKPEIYFPAGGAYAIYGKFNQLNKYIAQASFPEAKLRLNRFASKVINIIGGGHIYYEKNTYSFRETNFYELNESFIKKISNFKYYYSQKSKKIDKRNLGIIFSKASENYFRILKKFKIKENWDIKFNTYKNLQLNKNCLIDKKKSKLIKTYSLKKEDSNFKNKYVLECHLDLDLFKNLLKGKFPWNTSISGSTILFKRNPNIYNVDLDFSLNFLRV